MEAPITPLPESVREKWNKEGLLAAIELHDAYVDLAKECIKVGIVTVEEFAKEADEDVTELVQITWAIACREMKIL